MKRICKCLKKEDYIEAKVLANKAIADIPKRNNRVRAHKYSDVMVHYIYEHIIELNIDSDGMEGLYEYNDNLGTSRWPDYVRVFKRTVIHKSTKARFSISAAYSYVENVIVLI